MTVLLLALLGSSLDRQPAQDTPGPKLFVKDGRLEGVFYGFTVLEAQVSRPRRPVWTFRRDGLLLFGAPPGSLENFLARPLTDAEKRQSGPYEISGDVLKFAEPDGEKHRGKIETASDGSVVRIRVEGTERSFGRKRFIPVRPGIDFGLQGTFQSTGTVDDYTLSGGLPSQGAVSLVNLQYTFVEEGEFGFEMFIGVTTRGGRVHTDETRPEGGRFERGGSGLELKFEYGLPRSVFVGQLGSRTEGGEVSLILDGKLYTGVPGKFKPRNERFVKTRLFELYAPKGWKGKEVEGTGAAAFRFDGGSVFTVFAADVTLDAGKKPSDAPVVQFVRDFMAKMHKDATLENNGAAETLRVNGYEAVRVPMRYRQEGGRTVLLEGYVVARGGGGALIGLEGVEAGWAGTAVGPAKELLGSVRLSGGPQPLVTAHFEIAGPPGWTAREIEEQGTRSLALMPATVDDEGKCDLVVLLASSVVGADAPSMKNEEMLKQFRGHVEAMQSGLAQQGKAELFEVDSAEAAFLRYAGKNDQGHSVGIHAYGLIRNGKFVMAVAAGKESAVAAHGAALRRAFETLRVKK